MCLDKHGLGRELQSIRKELNLTIEEASFLAGINEKTIYRIEHGINKVSSSTLDKLSIAYKKDLFTIYNKYISNPKIKLSNIIREAEKSIYIDNLENIKTCINQLTKLELNQFTSYEVVFIKYYIKLLEATYIDLKYYDRLKAVNLLINSIKSEINDFQIINYKNFNYSSIEKRILMNIATMAYSLYEDKTCIGLLSHIITLSNNDNILYPKSVLNLSTVYHKKGDFKKSFYLTDKGITYCIKNKCLYVLPKFFFRKFTSELNLGLKNYEETLRKAIFLAEINHQEYLKDIFITSAKNIYGVAIDLVNFE